jgi:GntR family transcriptional regulator
MTIVRDANARLSRTQWGAGLAIQDADTGLRPRSVAVQVAVGPAPAWAAVLLGFAEPRPKVAVRSRRFTVDERIVQLSTSYLPLELARQAGLLHEYTGPGGAYARLAEIGHEPVRFVEQVRGRMPDPDEANALICLWATRLS